MNNKARLSAPVMFIALGFFGWGCVNGQEEKGHTDESRDASSEPVVEKVPPETFKTLMEKHDEAVLLDVRTPREVQKGAIKGAENLNFQSSDFKDRLLEKTGPGHPVLVYCASGGRSGKTAEILKNEGDVELVYDLKGGYKAWKRKGFAD